MTTTVKIHVNGKYRATVKQDDREPVTVEGNYNGGSGEQSFWLAHPANSKFEITEDAVKAGDERPAEPAEQSFGQKAVGLDFNPSGDEGVRFVKQKCADLIDFLHSVRSTPGVSAGKARHASTAITQLEDAQMRAVKALTWRD